MCNQSKSVNNHHSQRKKHPPKSHCFHPRFFPQNPLQDQAPPAPRQSPHDTPATTRNKSYPEKSLPFPRRLSFRPIIPPRRSQTKSLPCGWVVPPVFCRPSGSISRKNIHPTKKQRQARVPPHGGSTLKPRVTPKIESPLRYLRAARRNNTNPSIPKPRQQ